VDSTADLLPAIPKVLLAGVGYANLRDVSVGPVLAARLAERQWPAGVEVHDYSFGAIDAIHRLRDGAYDRAVFFGSIDRGEEPGSIRRYVWESGKDDDAAVQERVAEAAQAVISLDTTLIVTSYFGALPKDTVVFEVEPEDLNFGDGFSPKVEHAVSQLVELLEKEVAPRG